MFELVTVYLRWTEGLLHQFAGADLESFSKFGYEDQVNSNHATFYAALGLVDPSGSDVSEKALRRRDGLLHQSFQLLQGPCGHGCKSSG